MWLKVMLLIATYFSVKSSCIEVTRLSPLDGAAVCDKDIPVQLGSVHERRRLRFKHVAEQKYSSSNEEDTGGDGTNLLLMSNWVADFFHARDMSQESSLLIGRILRGETVDNDSSRSIVRTLMVCVWPALIAGIVCVLLAVAGCVYYCCNIAIATPSSVCSSSSASSHSSSSWSLLRCTGVIGTALFLLCVTFCMSVLLVACSLMLLEVTGHSEEGGGGSAWRDLAAVTNNNALHLRALLQHDRQHTADTLLQVIDEFVITATAQIRQKLRSKAEMARLIANTYRLNNEARAIMADARDISVQHARLQHSWTEAATDTTNLQQNILPVLLGQCKYLQQHQRACAKINKQKLRLEPLHIATDVIEELARCSEDLVGVNVQAVLKNVQQAINMPATQFQHSAKKLTPEVGEILKRGEGKRHRLMTSFEQKYARQMQHLQQQRMLHHTGNLNRNETWWSDRTLVILHSYVIVLPCCMLVCVLLGCAAVIGALFPSGKSSRPHRHTINSLRCAQLLAVILASCLLCTAAVSGVLSATLTASVCRHHRSPHDTPAISRTTQTAWPRDAGVYTSEVSLVAPPLLTATDNDTTSNYVNTMSHQLRLCRDGASLVDVFHLSSAEQIQEAALMDLSAIITTITTHFSSRDFNRSGSSSNSNNVKDSGIGAYLTMLRQLNAASANLATVKQQLDLVLISATLFEQLEDLDSLYHEISSHDNLTRQVKDPGANTARDLTNKLLSLQKKKSALCMLVTSVGDSQVRLETTAKSVHDIVTNTDLLLKHNISNIIQDEIQHLLDLISHYTWQYSAHVRQIVGDKISCHQVWTSFSFSNQFTCSRMRGTASLFWIITAIDGVLMWLLVVSLSCLQRVLYQHERELLLLEPDEQLRPKLWQTLTSSNCERCPDEEAGSSRDSW